MSLLSVEDLKFNYQDKELYNNVSFKLNRGEHVALVGVNGSGKTTLLNIITKSIIPDEGKVIWENHVTFSYLDQHLKVSKDITIDDYLYSVYKELFHKEKRMHELYELGGNISDPNYEKYLLQAQDIADELDRNGFYALSVKVGSVKEGLGIPSEYGNRTLKQLSSGEREKVYLAKMLLEEKDVLIMDEPTNFLDQAHVKWLADYLNNYPHAFLVISHDQPFLKEIASIVFCLENQIITRYKGDFDYFLSQHEVLKAQYEKNYLAQQNFIKKEEDFIKRNIVRATSSKAAKSKRARLAHIDRIPPPASNLIKVHFSFPFSHDVGEKVLDVKSLVIGYDNKPLLEPISLLIKKGQHIAILGQNGVGKSTFIKTILGEIPSISGSFSILKGTTVNYYSQDEHYDSSLTPVLYLKQFYPNMTNTELRTILGSCGIRKELAVRSLNKLSGGEVSKTRIALMCLKKANMLILDEPTNHLDQTAKEALFDAIKRFPGCVIIVSHEKDFYDGLVDFEIRF